MSVSARFAHLSSSNAPLTSVEVASIEKELSGLEKLLKRRRQEVELLEITCQAYEKLLAPLRRLAIPSEILGVIFQHVMSDTASKSTVAQLRTICLVCRMWREVALATPRLWVKLDLSVTKSHFIRVEKVKEWFSRSGSIPKTLAISSGHYRRSPADCPLQNANFERLLARGPPLEHFSLKCDRVQCFSSLLGAIGQSAGSEGHSSWDALRSLTLDMSLGWGQGWGEVPSPKRILFHLPAALTTLHLTLPAYDDLPNEMHGFFQPLSLPNLQILNLTLDWGLLWIVQSLKGCNNVDTLTLNFRERGVGYSPGDFNDNTAGPAPREVASLPALRILRLEGLISRKSHDTLALRYLSCPSITDLDISFFNSAERPTRLLDDPDMTHTSPASVITRFIAQSEGAPSLKHFRLHGLKVTSLGLVPILRALPAITHLTLQDLDIDEGICTRMADDSTLLPRLETLEFIDFPLNFGRREFECLVLSRTPEEVRISNAKRKGSSGVTLAPLKVARLSHIPKTPRSSDSKDSDWYWVRNIRQKGVDISMNLLWE